MMKVLIFPHKPIIIDNTSFHSELSLSVEPAVMVAENVPGLMLEVCAVLATSPTTAMTDIAVSIVLSTVDGTGRY